MLASRLARPVLVSLVLCCALFAACSSDDAPSDTGTTAGAGGAASGGKGGESGGGSSGAAGDAGTGGGAGSGGAGAGGAGSGGAGSGGGGTAGAGGAGAGGGPQLCTFPNFWCVSSCAATTKSLPACVNGKAECPAGTVSTGTCGCDPSLQIDCWSPTPHTPECLNVGGSKWKWCCDPSCK